MGKEVDAETVGQEKPNKDPSQAYDSANGRYKDTVHDIPMTDRTQESTMPLAPNPSPFKIGPLGR